MISPLPAARPPLGRKETKRQSNMNSTNRQLTPSLLRRLAAIVYDGLLLLGAEFLLTALVLPLTGGEAIAPGNLLYRTYLLVGTFLFFGGFWTHGGQTLGMRAWRIKVQQANGQMITWLQALLRFGFALVSWLSLGAGFWWALVDKQGKAWHDRLSATELVLVSPKINKADAA